MNPRYWELNDGRPTVDGMLAKMIEREDAITGTALARLKDADFARLVINLKAASQMARRYLAEVAEERGELALKLAAAELSFENEKATGRDLERLHELATLDYERERAENERLRSALNRIAMSSLSSEAAKGIAAVALQVPRGENAVKDPAAPGAAEQHSADSRTASGVTGRRDGQCIQSATLPTWHPRNKNPEDDALYLVADRDGQMAFASWTKRYGWEHVCDNDCGPIIEWAPIPKRNRADSTAKKP